MGEKTLSQEIKQAQTAIRRDARTIRLEPVRYTVKGLGLLVEAAAMGITSGYTIYSGWHDRFPAWGSAALLTAGAFIAIRAFVEFVKFLNRRG